MPRTPRTTTPSRKRWRSICSGETLGCGGGNPSPQRRGALSGGCGIALFQRSRHMPVHARGSRRPAQLSPPRPHSRNVETLGRSQETLASCRPARHHISGASARGSARGPQLGPCPSAVYEENTMLELRPTCEHRNKALSPVSLEARICSYECTFCARCVESVLGNLCQTVGARSCPGPSGHRQTGRATTFSAKTPRARRSGTGQSITQLMQDSRPQSKAFHRRGGRAQQRSPWASAVKSTCRFRPR
jgi:uncharacterized protein